MAQLAQRPGRIKGLAEWMSNGTLPEIEQWIREHYMYRPEREEILRSPDHMMSDLERLGYVEGDCDDATIFVAALFRSMGIPVQMVAIRYNPIPEFEHVFAEIWTGSGWYTLDPTVKPGTRYRTLERMVEHV